MMVNISWLERKTGYSLSLLVVIGLSMLPSASCEYCNTEEGEPQINISSTPPSNNLSIGAAINLTCTAWQSDELAKNPKKRPNKIEWFDPQDKKIVAAECQAGEPPAALMKCPLVVGALTNEKRGIYTCRARNGNGCSTKKFPIGLEEPDGAPQNVKGKNSSSTSIFVIWDEVPAHQQNGIITGYTITYKSQTENDNGTALAGPNDRHMELTGLKEFVNYNITVFASTIKGDGPASDTIVVRTDQDKPDGAPQNVKGKNNNSTSILVMWDEVPAQQQNGIITGYTITYKPQTENDNGTVLAGPNDRHMELTGLKEFVNYNITVFASTVKGDGPASDTIVVRTDQDIDEDNFTTTPLVKGTEEPHVVIVAITVPLSVTIMFLVAVSVFVQHFRRRCLRNQTYNNENPEQSVTSTQQMQVENQLENIYDYIDSNPSLITPQQYDEVPPSCHTPEENPLLGTLGVESPVKKSPQTKPLAPISQIERESRRMEENSEHNVTCFRMLPSERQNPNLQTPDTCTLDTKGSGGNIVDEQDISLDIEKNTGLFAELQETEKEPWLLRCKTDAETKPMQSAYCVDSSPGVLRKVRELLPTPDFELAPPKSTKETKESKKNNDSSSINPQEIEEDYEIDLKRLEVQDVVLGEGEFGIVYKGRYHSKNNKAIDVAVKQLKDTAGMDEKVALLGEIRMLKRAGRHPNIVNLVGACTQGENVILVTDLIPGGTLESLLSSKPAPGEHGKYENVRCALNDRELLKIALQIALGMQHLESKKCIHGDLAARNILIDENKVAKLGDFGLARDISDRGIYNKTSNGRVPWRWLSLESLRFLVYTSQSDVWSFGILLWEIATFGEVPYSDIATPRALVRFLSSGRRMPRPDHCTKELYALMQNCWMENPLMRPSFGDITKCIKYLLRKVKRSYMNVQHDDITDDSETL